MALAFLRCLEISDLGVVLARPTVVLRMIASPATDSAFASYGAASDVVATHSDISIDWALPTRPGAVSS